MLQVQSAIWCRPRGRLLADQDANAGVIDHGPITPEREARASAIALAISRVAEHGVFRPRCLARAVALQRLLRREGIGGSRVRVGVRRVEGCLDAHAWVELNGLVLGDRVERVGGFAPFPSITVLEHVES